MITMHHPALLIIDMQNDFVEEGALLRVAQAETVIPKIQDVLWYFRSKNLPIFHVLRVHRADGSDVEITRADLFSEHPFAVKGTHGAEEVAELTSLPGEYVIEKTRMSAFIGTELDLMLKTLGADGVVVCGIQTPNCIRTTVFDAIAYNYPVILVADATGAQSEDIHDANLRDMANIGVTITNAQDILSLFG